MVGKITKELHYGKEVSVNKLTESYRKFECLCLNCSSMDDCPAAKKLYAIAIEHNLAMAITRCPEFLCKK